MGPFCACVSSRVYLPRFGECGSLLGRRTCVGFCVSIFSRRKDGRPRRTTRHSSVPKRKGEREREIGVPVERKNSHTSRRRRREAAVEAEVGETAVRSDGFVFLHNGGAKRPQAVGLWGVFPSSARDVLPCKCHSFYTAVCTYMMQ